MECPEKYIQGNIMQRKEATDFLSKYFHLVQWRHSEREIILDVGCGSGDVTWEILRPLLPKGTKIVGADLSPNMLEYAINQYPNAEWITLDITMAEIPESLQNKFHHIFSFHCLHWIKDQNDYKQALKNIYNMLKPGGDIFTYYAANCVLYDAYCLVGKMDKYKPYIDDPNRYLPFHQNDKKPVANVQSILNDIGFKVKVCKHVERYFVFQDRKMLKNFLIGCSPVYYYIPTNLRPSYIEDLTRVLLNLQEMKIANIKEYQDEYIKFPFSNLFIYATK